MYRVQKGVPAPQGTKPGPARKYPINEMEVGDSFLAEGEQANSTRCKALNSAKSYGRRTGKKFRARTVLPGRVRIWRVA